MKSGIRFCLVVLLSGLAVNLMAARQSEKKEEQDVTVISTSRHLLYFKVSRSLVGAKIEIVDSAQREVGLTEVMGRKMLIDFVELLPDTYTIRFTKNGKTIEKQCVKTSLGLFEL